ncbi:hypothetical protein DFJ74DRAFT_767403 [Hyaloraphidium curvatum]|nr:hypothetical protein DFJ74DRAFT_767403 [Hyaloraphidium curvatum]
MADPPPEPGSPGSPPLRIEVQEIVAPTLTVTGDSSPTVEVVVPPPQSGTPAPPPPRGLPSETGAADGAAGKAAEAGFAGAGADAGHAHFAPAGDSPRRPSAELAANGLPAAGIMKRPSADLKAGAPHAPLPAPRPGPRAVKVATDEDPRQLWALKEYASIPLSIVIMIVGSRGDVQPFVALGKMLKETYGHRVRLATHETFRKFVTVDGGLEFFPLAGDPAELMAYMVKNPGLIPGMSSIRAGDIGKKRATVAAILETCWDACHKPDPGPPAAAAAGSKSAVDQAHGAGTDQAPAGPAQPFVAQLIISNPVTFAHIHCAQKLRVPLHIMFTMPWTPTRAFPHPLIKINSSGEPGVMNYLSYSVVENLTWSGMGDVINNFRKNTLNLPVLTQITGPYLLTSHPIPFTYTWSPDLVRKPDDWCAGTYPETRKAATGGSSSRTDTGASRNTRAATATILRGAAEDRELIDVCGFLYLDSLTANYAPPAELASFLERKTDKKIVYIGFGSIVIPDPDAFTKLILEAVKLAGVRALVSQGWGGLGMGDQAVEVVDGEKQVMVIGNTPHDWLFLQIDAVVHHGGAGTTAAGLKAGRPTMVVPFFGDQPFWGAMVNRMGVGAAPIPFKKLTAQNLAESLRHLIKPEVRAKAEEIGEKMREETGVLNACRSIHRHLPLAQMTCDIFPDRLATHYLAPRAFDKSLPLISVCKPVRDLLIQTGEVPKSKWKSREGGFVKWNLDDVSRNLIEGTLRAAKDLAVETVKGAGSLFYEPAVGFKAAASATTPGAKTKEVFRGLGRGLGHFVYYPIKGGGKVIGDLADGLRNTPNTLEGRPMESRRQVHHAADGIGWGTVALGQGVAEGLYDFFAKPVTISMDKGPAIGVPLGILTGSLSVVFKPMAGAMDFVYMSGRGIKETTRDLFDRKGAKRRKEADKAYKKVGVIGGVLPSAEHHLEEDTPRMRTPSPRPPSRASAGAAAGAAAANGNLAVPVAGSANLVSTTGERYASFYSFASNAVPHSDELTEAEKEYALARFREMREAQRGETELFKKQRDQARQEREEEVLQEKALEERIQAGREATAILGNRTIQVDRVLIGADNDVLSLGSLVDQL